MILRRPEIRDKDKIISYAEEFNYDICGGGKFNELKERDFDAVLNKIRDEEAGIVDEGRVPATQFLYLDDDENLIGMIQLRHGLTDYLLNYAGHIGYSISPKFRKKGHGSNMLKACLCEARKLGLERVLVTCGDWNKGSRGVIENNGGVYEDAREDEDGVHLRFWIQL